GHQAQRRHLHGACRTRQRTVPSVQRLPIARRRHRRRGRDCRRRALRQTIRAHAGTYVTDGRPNPHGGAVGRPAAKPADARWRVTDAWGCDRTPPGRGERRTPAVLVAGRERSGGAPHVPALAVKCEAKTPRCHASTPPELRPAGRADVGLSATTRPRAGARRRAPRALSTVMSRSCRTTLAPANGRRRPMK